VTTSSLPVCIAMSPGNHHEGSKLISMMEEMTVRRPRRIHADTIYDTPLARYYLRRKHVIANIPSRARRKRPGRPRLFDREALRRIRYSVERFFSWVKNFRRIDTRYDRSASSFMGFVRIACSLILLKEVLR